MQINQKEIYRYLGYKNAVPADDILQLIAECQQEVLEVSEMQSFYKRFPLQLLENNLIKIENLQFTSKNLSKNLTGCSQVILFAATLGMETDRRLARYNKISMSKAVVFQATAAAAIEAYCNQCQQQIEEEMSREKLFVRPRFSPGYGDVALSIQKDFLEKIKASRTVGIMLNEGGLMVPEKSVTAFMGLSTIETKCHIEGCELCGNKDCIYRR